ncbi:MAG TPA: amidohydrolase, partial [Bacillota bacterium]|nr:amidohydrolase [Bacillota bacterium]
MSAKKILAIINAEIHTIAQKEPIQGSILVEDGKIAAVGQVEIPAEADIIDAAGASVYPGFIDPHT